MNSAHNILQSIKPKSILLNASSSIPSQIRIFQILRRLIVIVIVAPILLVGYLIYDTTVTQGDTMSLRPNSDGTASVGWQNSSGGTTNLYAEADDDPDSPNDSDYIRSPNRTANGMFVALSDTPVNFESATSIEIKARHREAGNGNDTVNIHYRIVASDESTPITDEVSTTLADNGSFVVDTYTPTITGTNTKQSWDGAMISLRITINQQQGPDDIPVHISAIEVNITYTPLVTLEQSSYRIYGNSDSTDVGSPLAAQNTGVALTTAGESFRVRTLLHVSSANLAQNGKNFKLQYAGKGLGTCQAPTGTPSQYTDVTSNTDIAYNNNATPADGASLTTNANDPTHGVDTVVAQTYEEANNFTNSVSVINDGQDGLWDFSLKDNNAPAGTAYCFRIVKSNGAPLNSYTAYPQITTALPPLEQVGYRWFEDADSSGSTASGGPTNIDNASNFGVMTGSGRQVVRDSNNNLYAAVSDGSTCEIWKSSDGSNWSQQHAASSPTSCGGVSAAIDGAGKIHLVYINTTTQIIRYITFDTTSSLFGADEEVATDGYAALPQTDIAIDSNNKPHLVAVKSGTYNSVHYFNKVGTSWTAIEIQGNPTQKNAIQPSIAISEDNIPEIAHLNSTDEILVASVGNANNATSFTQHNVDSNVNTHVTYGSTSIGIDSDGNTWISYSDLSSMGRLSKHVDADSWSTWQTPISNGTPYSLAPSLAINGTDIYMFYWSEFGFQGVSYDIYNGSSWTGPTNLHLGAIAIKAKQSTFWNNNSVIDYLYSTSSDVFWASLGLGPSPADVGPALADQNIGYTMIEEGQEIRLRALISSPSGDLSSGTGTFKLQYADKGAGTCEAPSGGTPSTYTDVTSSTYITYRDIVDASDGGVLTTNANDPVRSGIPVIPQTYTESNPFSNVSVIPAGGDGLWDFSLADNGAPAGTTYCFRIVNGNDTPLNSYNQYPSITTFGSSSQTFPPLENVLRGGKGLIEGLKLPFFTNK